jgi:hypothetical protein
MLMVIGTVMMSHALITLMTSKEIMSLMEIMSFMEIMLLMEVMSLMEIVFMTFFPLTSLMDALLLFANSLNVLSLYANITIHMQAACRGITAKIQQP